MSLYFLLIGNNPDIKGADILDKLNTNNSMISINILIKTSVTILALLYLFVILK